jgi:hypothetical protein
MKLQGNVRTNAVTSRAIKGAIWQVLPVFGDLMKGFEEARQLHLPAESQIAQDLSNRATSPTTTQLEGTSQLAGVRADDFV